MALAGCLGTLLAWHVCLCQGQTVSRGPRAMFAYQGEIIITHDSWLVTVCLPLTYYSTNVQILSVEMDNFQNAVKQFHDRTQSNSSLAEIRNTLSILIDKEMEQFMDELSKLNQIYRQLYDFVTSNSLNTQVTKCNRRNSPSDPHGLTGRLRTKHALLPFMGPLFWSIIWHPLKRRSQGCIS